MSGVAIIGGKADGRMCPLKAVEITFEGDRYLLMAIKESGKYMQFYMLTGMVPAEAVKIFKDRQVK